MALKKINIDEYTEYDERMVEYFKSQNASFYYNENTFALYTRCPDEHRYHWIGYALKKINRRV